MGIVDSMDTAQARWQARQAMLQAQKELQTICGQVRTSYVRSLDKERNVEESSNEVRSALEELRLAELRKSSGLGIEFRYHYRPTRLHSSTSIASASHYRF